MAVAAQKVREADDPADANAGAVTRPVDLVHLARYTMGNRDLEREVLCLFAKQAEIYLERLKEARSDRTWVEAAHTLKGSARSIGAWHVAEAAEEAEAMHAHDGRARLAEELAARVEEANGFIRNLLAES